MGTITILHPSERLGSWLSFYVVFRKLRDLVDRYANIGTHYEWDAYMESKADQETKQRVQEAWNNAGNDREKLLIVGQMIDDRWNDDEVNRAYLRLIHLEPDRAEYHALLGRSILRYGVGERCGCDPLDPVKQALAFEHLGRAIELEPNQVMAYQVLAQAYSELLQTAKEADEPIAELLDKVIHYYRRWADLIPEDAEAHLQLAWNLVHASRIEEAESQIERYMALSTNPNRWEQIAALYTFASQYEKARDYLLVRRHQVGSLDANWRTLVDAYATCGNVDEAIQCIRDNCSDEDQKSIRTAMVYYQAGQFAEAVTEFEKLDVAASRDWDVRRYYPLSLTRLGRVEEAMAYFQARIRAEPEIGDSYLDIARYYVALADYESAIGWGERALERNPSYVGTINLLALCRKELDKKALPDQ